MRTRRIAIRCRRTGRSATVAIGTTGTGLPADLPGPEMPPGLEVTPVPDLDLPPVYGAPAAEPPVTPPTPAPISVPAYLADPGPTPDRHIVRHDGRSARVPVNPWRTNRGPDLTLADIVARPGRRDLDWDRNPGWPAGVGWAYIAGGRAPRHARTAGWRVPGSAVVGAGIALFVTALIMLVADLFR